jgi:two-component system, chemotaxis family, CheB/CheR fusion protein
MDTSEAQRPLIVGVGASAGGLEALMQLLEPAELPLGAAIIVIQHLAPDHRSLMVELLGQHTRLSVVPATDQTLIEPDTVYVIQPRTLVRVTPAGRLAVAASERHNLRPIDLLFESLAESCGSACAGVVLSGTGQDGTLGLQALKKAGGLTIVQRPETARFDGMPQAALASGCVDLMLAPDEVLAEVRSSLLQPEAVFGGESDVMHLRLLGTIFAALRSHTGVDFSHYRLGTIARRVERRMEQRKVTDLAAYTKLVQNERDEAMALQQELLIGVTAFMRDTDAIEVLRTVAIPRLLESGDTALRVWVAGCSSGEEAYSIAMLIDDALRTAGSARELKLFATDIDERALDRASQGKFSAESVAAIPAPLSERYLVSDGGEYIVAKNLREKLLFSRHNVVTDPPFPRIHLATCRNLLIYLKPRVQQRVLTTLSNALTPDGLLWLGSSETLGARAEDFEVLDQRWKLFRAKPERPRHAMAIAMAASVRRELVRPARADLGQEISQALVSGLLPPTIVVDEGMQLAYRYGNVGALIHVPEGKASLDVRELLPHSLAVVVSMAVQRARNTQEDSVFRNLSVQLHDGTISSFDVRARPLRVRGRILVAMVFEQSKLPSEGDSSRDEDSVEIAPAVQMRMNSLERELRESQAHLQSTVEELESSNQELQATNEELVASNEELQSTNEELQSVNEELHTINAEHSQRLDELTQITQDLDQLLSTLDVGIVFLDTDLNIRRFNKRAAAYISVLPQDIGRPLTHLTHTLDYAELLNDCIRVIKTGESHTCTVRWRTGRVKVRVHSFSGPANQPKGLVITLADESS